MFPKSSFFTKRLWSNSKLILHLFLILKGPEENWRCHTKDFSFNSRKSVFVCFLNVSIWCTIKDCVHTYTVKVSTVFHVIYNMHLLQVSTKPSFDLFEPGICYTSLNTEKKAFKNWELTCFLVDFFMTQKYSSLVYMIGNNFKKN